jgi:two-component system KDP operon response regulator KdpE
MFKKKNVLLIADVDQVTKKMMDLVLEDGAFKLIDCTSGRQAISLCVSVKPDLVVLELNLPDMHGVEVIKALREWSDVPIIVISLLTDNESVISSLDAGANDYIFKPFNTDVLISRINAALRSSATKEAGEPELHNGFLRMDLVRHEVFLRNKSVALTPKEYDLLRYFMIHQGKMLSHREILKDVWGDAHAEDTQYLRVFIGQIREKIEKDPSIPMRIVTKAGIGYLMEIDKDAQIHEQGVLKFSA